MTIFLRRGVVNNSPNPKAEAPPLAGCPRLLIQYIHSYTQTGDGSSILNQRTSMVWLKGPTYHGINCSLQLSQRPGFTLGSDRVMSVADEVAMGQVTFRVLPFLQSVPFRIKPPPLIITFI